MSKEELKPGSHLCDKHNTSSFFLVFMVMLMSLVLCLSHKCESGFKVDLSF